MKKILLPMSALLFFAGCASDVVSHEEALRQRCGGFAGIACPEGYACMDDPRDSCDPANGGADCGGICRRERRTRCDYNQPGVSYVGQSVEECSTIRFVCAEGQEYFADDCGCGCRETASACTSIGLCVEGYTWDDASCDCVPTGTPCGGIYCAQGEVCCNESCGICTPPDGFCIDLYCAPTL